VHALVGAAGSVGLDNGTEDAAERVLDITLNGAKAGLPREAVERGAVVCEVEPKVRGEALAS
jgi:hypothetical protein